MSTDSEPGALIGALTRVASEVHKAFDRCAAEAGVAASQARLLRALGDRAPTINELAAQLGLDKSSTSGLVDRAERRGLVRRVPSQVDRRSVRVRLTSDGHALAERIHALVGERLAAMVEPLAPGQRSALATLLARLSDG